jgi:hypothetical protein
MYDNDPEDIAEIGWDRFVSGSWESIFAGYRSISGIRTLGRRWSDLLQGGLGCSQEVADLLVGTQVMQRQDRDLMVIRDPEQLLLAMDEVLADMGADLSELGELGTGDRAALLSAHARLRSFLREEFLAPQDEAD